MDLNNLKLTDFIDVKTLQDIQDGFSNATGMAAVIVDLDGNAITRGSNFTDFCMKYNRQSPEGCRRCEKCDRQGGENTMRTGRSSVYYCHAGLMDFAAPIMVNNVHIGSFIGGQVLTSPIDEEKFRAYAKEIGVNPDEYVNAAKKVNVLPKHRIEKSAEFLCTLSGILSKIALSKYETTENSEKLSEINTDIITKINRAEELVADNRANMQKLHDEFDSLEKIAKKSVTEVNSTNETVKIIQDIAMNTRILGFNASLEAARAKESGKGFGVITQEIRTLAETSKESADKIENAMKSLSEFTKQIDKQIKNTETIVNECKENIEAFSKILRDICQ